MARPMLRMLTSRLAWDRMTPLGVPVLPEVYCKKAVSAALTIGG